MALSLTVELACLKCTAVVDVFTDNKVAAKATLDILIVGGTSTLRERVRHRRRLVRTLLGVAQPPCLILQRIPRKGHCE